LDLGFSITHQVFYSDELDGVREACKSNRSARRQGGVRGLLNIRVIRELAIDARLLTLASDFLGSTAQPLRATLFEKSAACNWLVTWHQDTVLPIRRKVSSADWGPWTMKAGQLHAGAPAYALEQIAALRIHLDDSTLENGPLRALPRTHQLGVLSRERIELLAATTVAVKCTTAAGGVVAMRPLAVHASSKTRDGSPRRRVLHIEYAPTTSFGEVELAF
jgi:ectoine hydroxylase-related dioxygenase (phytanoyl-CoA dioxygenase family)